MQGAKPVPVPMQFDAGNGWSLDIARIAAAITPRTRAIVLNTPANPTGWVATRADLEAVLAIARRHDLWIVADEIYGRFCFDPATKPSAGRPRSATSGSRRTATGCCSSRRFPRTGR